MPTQSRPRIGARIARRIGGAVREAIAGGLTLTGRRRTAAPTPARTFAASRPAGAAHLPGQPPAANLAAAAAPSRPGLLARWFGAGRPRPAPRRRAARHPDFVLTPETCPGTSQALCDVLNQPIGECDLETLRLIFSALARYIADARPAGMAALGLTNADDVFANMWGRLGGCCGDATLAPTPATEPDLPLPEDPSADAVAAIDAPLAESPSAVPASDALAAPGEPAVTAPATDHRQDLPADEDAGLDAVQDAFAKGFLELLAQMFPDRPASPDPANDIPDPAAPGATTVDGLAAAPAVPDRRADAPPGTRRGRLQPRRNRRYGPAGRGPQQRQRFSCRYSNEIRRGRTAGAGRPRLRRLCYAARASPA